MSFTDNTTGKNDWETPQYLFDDLNAEFSFTTDVCASEHNAKCPHYYTRETNGLTQKWTGTCWMNPPYGREIAAWIQKAAESKVTTVCLIPSRTDTRWWHQYVMPMAAEIRFLCGRVKFVGAEAGAKFPSAIVIFRNNQP